MDLRRRSFIDKLQTKWIVATIKFITKQLLLAEWQSAHPIFVRVAGSNPGRVWLIFFW